MKCFTIKQRLLTLFLIMAVVPCFFIGIAAPSYMRNHEINQTEKYMKSLTDSYAKTLDIYLDELDRMSLLAQINNDVLVALKLVNKKDFDSMSDRIKLMANRALNGEFQFYLQTTREDIMNVILIPINQEQVYISSKNGTLDNVEGYDFSSEKWLTEAVKADGRAVFCGPHQQKYIQTDMGKESVFTVSRAVIDTDKQKVIGVVCACADATILQQVVKEASSVEPGTLVAVLDDKNEYVYGDNILKDSLTEDMLEQKKVSVDGEKYSLLYEKTGTSWSLVSLLSYKNLNSKIRFYYVLGLVMAVISLGCMAVIYFGYIKTFTVPLAEIKRVMKAAQNNDLEARCKVESNDEMGDIEKELNKMVERLDQMIKLEYQAKLNQKNAEYEALQAQVQPHFLYNTLGVFVGLNRMGMQDELEEAIFSLRDLMRYALSDQKIVTIGEEAEFIRKYLRLQKLRFMDKINEQILIDPKVQNFKIPRHLFQPIVENAVIHGIEEADHSCQLTVTANLVQEADKLCVMVVIADDGVGFDVNKVQYDDSVGIKNVENRFKHYFPNSEFQIISQVNNGTKILFKIYED